MRKLIVATVLSAVSAFAFAQAAAQTPSKQVTSGGVNIKGNTNVVGVAGEQTAVAVGKGNTAKNTVGAIKGGTNIKGNTNVVGVAGKQTAVAVGKGNTAENQAGVIGGK